MIVQTSNYQRFGSSMQVQSKENYDAILRDLGLSHLIADDLKRPVCEYEDDDFEEWLKK